MLIVVRAFFYRGLWLCSFLTMACLSLGLSSVQAEEAVTQADLEKVANQSEVEITTIGRKTGNPHTKPIWFVYDQGHFYIQSGKEGKSDWYQNLKKDPDLKLKIGELAFSGRAKFIDDEKETERVHGLFREKYLRARLSSWIGSEVGHGNVVEVEIH